jgi:peptidoglycan/xylan/chitin deacetylase (PgdA/CDA1 family)
MLVERGYRSTTFSEAVTHPARAERTLAVTFDDGYRSVIELGLPILSKLGLVGTVFVVTTRVGTEAPVDWPGVDHWVGGPHEQELVPMGTDELGRLIDAGWEIGSHTRTHPHLTEIDDEQLEHELHLSRRECYDLIGRPVGSIAYPYGDVDERVVKATFAAGYRAAGSLPTRFRAPRSLEWPRVGVYYGDDGRRFRMKVSPNLRRVRNTLAWDVAEGARRALRR